MSQVNGFTPANQYSGFGQAIGGGPALSSSPQNQASPDPSSVFGQDSYTPDDEDDDGSSSQNGSYQVAAMGEDGKIPVFELDPKGNPVMGPDGGFLPSAEALRRNGGRTLG